MQTDNTQKVEVSKDFIVPPDKLYKAWTEPEQLKQWWKPMNNLLVEVKNDVKEGGSVSYIFKDNGLQISGNYLEVAPGEKLVYTWNWKMKEEAVKNGDYTLTVKFEAKDNGSTITITQENIADEEGTHPHEEGWNKGLEDLTEYLSGNTDNDASANGNALDNVGGYNEAPEQAKVAGG